MTDPSVIAVVPDIATVVSGSALYQAVLASGGWERPPKAAHKLRSLGTTTRGMETNTLRIPIWAPVRALQLSMSDVDLGPVYGSECVVKGHAKMPDFRLLVELVDAYVRADCPEHRIVPFTLGDAARVLGYREGGRQREAVKDALDRLVSVRIRRTVVRFGDRGKRHEETLGYGLIGQYRTSTRGEGRGWVELTAPLAILARLGELTYLDHPTLDTLLARDDVAARLWSYLEADAGPGKGSWRYSLFAEDAKGIARQRDMPALADLLWLRAERRRDTVARIRRAAGVIEQVDSRYQLRIVKSPEPGMWRLEASREEVKTDDAEVRAHDAKGKSPRRGEVRTDDAKLGQSTLRLSVSGEELPSISTVVSLPSDTGDPIRDALVRAFGRRLKDGQVQLARALASRKGLSAVEASAVMDAARPQKRDPIEAVREYRKPPRPIRTVNDIQEPPPIQDVA
ncbi:MAG TPA: hypothetical protein VMP86_07690 [Candidatus Binatia bacterium]|nr:hypothetical protein [Candidatus Binatia bacterium]